MPTNNAINSGFPVGTASGGTGNSSFTAYTVICGGTTSTGALQHVTSVGTSGQVLTSNGAGALPTFQTATAGGFTSITVQKFTSSGTYTPTSGMKYCIVEVCGGGGGGGGVASTDASTVYAGGGGGGGGYARGVFSSTDIGGSQSVTVGSGGGGGSNTGGNGSTGGTSSLGSLISGAGGQGGNGSSAAINISGNTYANGGSGGSASGGNLQVAGNGGNLGYSIFAQNVAICGPGGSSFFCGSAIGIVNTIGTIGFNGNNYGGGAGGAANVTSQGTGKVGGTGGNGIVIITEFVS